MAGEHKFTARISVSSIIVNIVMSLILVNFFGLAGIALGTLLSTLFNNVIFTLKKAAKEYAFPYYHYLTKVYLPVLWPGLFLVGIGFALKKFFPVVSLWDMMMKAIPGVIVYLILFWIFSLPKEMKMKIRNKLFTRY